MKQRAILAGIFLMATLAGCSSVPKWARKGAGAMPVSDKVFYGVGEADSSIASRSLRVEAAENRARSDLQRYFDTYTGYLMREYDGPDGKSVERVVKTFSAGHLSGVRIAERYETDGKVYALAKLDMAEFRRVLANAPELGEKTRQSILKRADELFEKLREEEIRQESTRLSAISTNVKSQ